MKLRLLLDSVSFVLILAAGVAWLTDWQLPAASKEPTQSRLNTSDDGIDEFLDTWFASPDSPGSVAIGMAEGTRTLDGGKTQNWDGHYDPAWLNHRVGNPFNMGTFSCQTCEARDAASADEELLTTRLRPKAREIFEKHPDLTRLEKLAVVDALVQAPKTTYGDTATLPSLLKQYRGQEGSEVEAVAKARAESFVSPVSGRLEAGGFGNNRSRLDADQLRRTQELARKLELVQQSDSLYGDGDGRIVCDLRTGQCFAMRING